MEPSSEESFTSHIKSSKLRNQWSWLCHIIKRYQKLGILPRWIFSSGQPVSLPFFILLLFFILSIGVVWRRSSHCSHIFIDLGSNVGDSIEKFVDPYNHQYRHSYLAKIVREHKWQAKDFCIYGFEGNPRFKEKLANLEKFLGSVTKRIQIFTETVVTTQNGLVPFYLDENSYQHNFWGSSLIASHRDVWMSGKKSIQVYGIDFSSFLAQVLGCSFRSCKDRRKAKTVIVQMDVEGEEYSILRQLLMRNMLCGVIDYLLVEFHSHAFRLDDNTTVKGAPPLEFEKCFHWLAQHPECKTTVITQGLVDDYQNV
ncbi:uncharacterized protein Gasu_37880 [Galdieria sulphuraria]|uniref:Methyltransferase FkbM domain-containing protein n=1 Tax=Galdieria sulphuraria TaxID=130081 RepID=M2XFF4_GALSU|nr:uncharacterized protein Gasu_37880 [Galdieria sulphuraria]EME28737.1 hypothetical protein Gasu_37880 [Galdieria sulphuraria]|eukprot:XP_005705257.1 hypothetical protein Gasu_37880 [Galdieria sulphuraria]